MVLLGCRLTGVSLIHPDLHFPSHLLLGVYFVSFLEDADLSQHPTFNAIFLDNSHVRRVDV